MYILMTPNRYNMDILHISRNAVTPVWYNLFINMVSLKWLIWFKTKTKMTFFQFLDGRSKLTRVDTQLTMNFLYESKTMIGLFWFFFLTKGLFWFCSTTNRHCTQICIQVSFLRIATNQHATCQKMHDHPCLSCLRPLQIAGWSRLKFSQRLTAYAD